MGLMMVHAVGCQKDHSNSEHESAAVEEKLGEAAEQFVNTTCPIMNSKINPAAVPAALTRTYKDKKVAFCCGDCPAAWDKLSDAEKDAKLAKAK